MNIALPLTSLLLERALGGSEMAIDQLLQQEYPWSLEQTAYIVSMGYLPAVEYLHTHRYWLVADPSILFCSVDQPHVLRWLHQQGHDLSPRLMDHALASGNMESIKYIASVGIRGIVDPYFIALRSNNLVLLDWLLQRGHKCRANDYLVKFSQDNLTEEVSQWLLARSLEMTKLDD